MRKTLTIKYFTGLIYLISLSLTGQNIRHLSTNEGLPQSFVSGLAQDKDGFVWIATRNGLTRYDGNSFKIFQHKYNDSTSLASSIIMWTVKDANNNLWIEYESGEIDVLGLDDYKVRHFISNNFIHNLIKPLRRGWIVASDGTFWSTSASGNIYALKDIASVKSYNHDAYGFSGFSLKGIFEDKKKRIWVLSEKGISRFIRQYDKFQHYSIPYTMDFGNAGADDAIIDIHERENGELMWGDRQNLIFFNPETVAFRKIALPPAAQPGGIKWISKGPDGKEYFETGRIIYSYDDENGLVVLSKARTNKIHDTKSFLVDRSGLIWVGTDTDGIYQLDFTVNFTSRPYKKSFAEDVLREKLNITVPDVFDWTDADEQFMSSGYSLRSINQGKSLWLALKQTVYHYDRDQNRGRKLPPIPGLFYTPGGDIAYIKGITLSGTGEPVVLFTTGEMFIYKKEMDRWDIFLENEYLKKMFEEEVQPLDIYSDKDKIWITTSGNGLLYIDVRSKKVFRLLKNNSNRSLPTNHLLGIKNDQERPDILWIGSYHGLICFNKKTMSSRVFTTEDGLPDNTVYSILSDKKGFLWLSTNKGLCRFDPVTRKTRIFTVSHGLQGNEFNRFHHLQLPDGSLVFGGPEGWTVFNPLDIKDDKFNTPVAVTDIKINNNSMFSQKKRDPVPASANSLVSLNLKHNENTLEIVFSGLEFNQPGDLTYRYKLEGYDSDWILSGNDREAVYTKIPSGNYVFKVNASNTTGTWSSTVKEIEITINPPWWRTWWACLLYALLVILSIAAYIRYRITQGILKKEMKLREKEALQLRELDEMKNRFFSNITHELRTPLTLILGPAEKIKTTGNKQDQNRLMATIIKNARQLLDLTNQLLDLSKLEARAMKPQLVRGNPSAVIESIADAFEEEARMKNISIRFNPGHKNREYLFPVEMLERIMYNLISNAVKFTLSGGRVELALIEKENGIVITVKDTGVGIPENKLPFVFDRFYRVNDDSSAQSGTGIGLSLVKELVDVQDGAIEVRSYTGSIKNESSGTEFIIFLPYKKAYSNTGGYARPDKTLTARNANRSKTPLILLVEDNHELAKFTIESLLPEYHVQFAENGEEGLKMAVDSMPDVVISDVLMPGMDGFTLCAHLKSDIRTSHIPVILLTAKVDFNSKITGLSQGADAYLTKPFHIEELLLRVKNLLERQDKLREFTKQKLGFLPEVENVDADHASNNFLEEIYSIIDKNLDDTSFGVEALAAALNISRTSLHRKIKAVTAMSAGEIIRAYRLKKAAVLLLENHNISETACKTGFASPAYFTKCFRELYGITPTEYARRSKAGV